MDYGLAEMARREAQLDPSRYFGHGGLDRALGPCVRIIENTRGVAEKSEVQENTIYFKKV